MSKDKPEIRFAGYTDAWEKRKLGDLGKVYTGNTPSTSDRDNWSNDTNEHVWITPSDIDDLTKNTSERHLSDQGWAKARKVPSNSVMVTSIASIGKNTINTVTAAFNQQINAIVPSNNDVYFILSSMNYNTPRFASLAGHTATAIINKKTFEKFHLVVPSLGEQKEIGNFFEKIDSLITVNQRKVDLLKELKKGFLQKMFPKNGENKPEIRFGGYTDAWEKRKFGELFNYERPDKYIVDSDNYDTSGIPVLTANKSFILGYTHENHLYDKGDSVIFDDFTLDNKYVNFPYKVKSSAIKILTETEGTSLRFAYELLNYTHIDQEGHARHYISIVQPKTVLVPQLSEQIRVAQLFELMDQLVTVNQRKVDLLKQEKKALLQKMFV